MANFSINQVRHLYVAKANKSTTPTEVGDIQVKKEGNTLMFKYMSPGGLVGSDIIDIDKIMYAKRTAADKMRKYLKSAEITFATGEAPIVGQEYIVRVAFRNYAGAGDDNMTFKYGMAVAKSNSVSDLLKELALSLVKNLKDIVPLATVHVAYGEDTVAVEPRDTVDTLNTELAGNKDAIDGIVIKEVEQPWVLGTKPATIMSFSINALPIIKEGIETNWADEKALVPVNSEDDFIINGKTIADLEWFTLGARGDSYRYFGYPHTVPTTYVADPTKEYDTIDIHYAYVGPNEGAQKSEKDITIAAEASVIGDIVTALGDVLA